MFKLRFDPPIGGIRHYNSHIDILYPGEEGIGLVEVDVVSQELTQKYVVRPMPGIDGWFLRTRFRLYSFLGIV